MSVKVELNIDGVRDELLRTQKTADVLMEYAEKVRSNCTLGTVGPDEYGAWVKIGETRAKAKVRPITAHAWYSNLKHNTLEYAIEAARD